MCNRGETKAFSFADIIFCTDLDNTLIYSYKHDIGKEKKCVELYDGREISFVTQRTYDLLKKVKSEMTIVPITTRSIEQYQRIDLGIGDLKYALVCNGGILLADGKSDEAWYQESLAMAKASREEIERSISLLDRDARRTFELRYIENLFVFTKCDMPENVVKDLKGRLNGGSVDVFHNGNKIYAIPKSLNKGNALLRFKKKAGVSYAIAAGDSAFDVPMAAKADVGLVPKGFCDLFAAAGNIKEMDAGGVFSEHLLRECLKIKAEAAAGRG